VATWRLLENNGALLQQLRSDPSITNEDVVHELLRFDMTTPLSNRFVVADGTELGGVKLAKDDRVVVCFSSANHDPSRFDKPDEINFKRAEGKKGPGWAFGPPLDGPSKEHNCLGRDLVYAVMKPVIQTLRDANPTPRLAANFTPAWGTPSELAMFRAMADLRVHC
jgi:cytochrome P450